MDRNLTPAQRKALLWLTPDARNYDAPRAVSAALQSLCLSHKDLATCSYEQTPRGRQIVAYRLTPLGAEIRASLES
jgi:hypothetical protein